MKSQDLNKLAQSIYEQNKAVGWWDGEQCIYTKLQLISTEIAEATEGERKDLMDDHLPKRKMGEVELADALIRTLDLGAHLGLNHTFEFPIAELGDYQIGGKHWLLTVCLVDFGRVRHDFVYTQLVDTIIQVAESEGYDIFGAMADKLEYNKNRSDHKRANRSKANGKKF